MRIALISDIHGNKVGLDAVLADLEAQPPDQLVCLGDVAITGPQPRAVVQQLQALGCPVVMGNTDAWLLQPEPWPTADERARAVLEVELWGARQLTAGDRAFVQTFQPVVEIPLPGGRALLCYHGSPRSYNDVIRPTTPAEELEPLLADVEAQLLAGGHTHEAMVRSFADHLLVNPGSVGLPLRREEGQMVNPLRAEYAVVEATERALRVELRRVAIEREALAETVHDSGMPHAELWLRDWR